MFFPIIFLNRILSLSPHEGLVLIFMAFPISV